MFEAAICCIVFYVRYGWSVFAPGWRRADEWLLGKEARWGRLRFSIMISLLLLCAAMIYTRLGTNCAFLGGQFATLAADPFVFDGKTTVAYRILTPLIAWLLGLRGCSILVLNLIIAGGLIWAVFDHFRRPGDHPSEALLAAAVMTFSFPTLCTVYYAGYTDSTTYLLVFLMWRFQQQRILYYALFGLALFNREAVVFLLPWFIWLDAQDAERRVPRALKSLGGLVLAVVPYLAFRWWAGQQAEVEYSLAHYLSHLTDDPLSVIGRGMGTLLPGIFAAFKLLWLLPVLAFIAAVRQGDRAMVGSLLLLVVVPLAQLLIAADTTRLVSLSFLAVIIGLQYLLRHNLFDTRRWLGWLVLGNLFVPNMAVAGEKVDIMHSFLWWGLESLMAR